MLRHAPALSHRPDHATSWFRSAEGRRYLRRFGGLIVLKIALLTALYFVFIAPQPRVDTSPERVFDAIRGAHAASAVQTPANTSSSSPTPREPTP